MGRVAQINLVYNATGLRYRKRRFQGRRSEMVRSTTVNLCEHVDLVQWYIAIFSSRSQRKRTTRNRRIGEGGPPCNCTVEVC